jgi:hypothetical protein
MALPSTLELTPGSHHGPPCSRAGQHASPSQRFRTACYLGLLPMHGQFHAEKRIRGHDCNSLIGPPQPLRSHGISTPSLLHVPKITEQQQAHTGSQFYSEWRAITPEQMCGHPRPYRRCERSVRLTKLPQHRAQQKLRTRFQEDRAYGATPRTCPYQGTAAYEWRPVNALADG